MPEVSIIIPTLDRYVDLQRTLRDLERQSYQDYELLVIDQSEHRKEALVRSWNSRLRYFASSQKSASAGRNLGIRMAKGSILLFIDDDVIIDDPDFLKKHVRHYVDPDVPWVVGASLEKRFDQQLRYERHRRSFRPAVGWLYFPSNYGCFCRVAVGRSNNLSVRKELAVAVGGMDENYRKGAHREEADFCLRVVERAGLFLFDPDARLIHVGNSQGGIRSWNTSSFLKAQHHFEGAVYFILKMVSWRHYPDHWVAALRYLLLNRPILIRPKLLFQGLRRLFKAWRYAKVILQKGPVYLNMDPSRHGEQK